LPWDEAVSSSERKAGKLYLNNVSLLKMEMLALSADWHGAGLVGLSYCLITNFVASKHL